MKAVNLLIESKLPEDIRNMNRRYDSKGISTLMAEVAEKYPDRYEEISHAIQSAGGRSSLLQGETIGVEDLRPVFDKDKLVSQMQDEIETARSRIQNPERFDEERIRIWQKYSEEILKRTRAGAAKTLNPIGLAVESGARGKAPQLQAMLSAPGLYTDYKDRIIPSFASRSFSEGVRPVDFLAGSFGGRKAIISTKRSTAMGGDFSKMLSQITAREVIQKKDCGTSNGIDLDLDDDSLQGRILARSVAGIPAGTLLDREALTIIRKAKPKKVVARSPLTCTLDEGLCAHCTGTREGGRLPSVGDHVGVTAANSIGAPIAQAALNQKHTGGQLAGQKKEFSGFKYISQFAQAPEKFPDGAILSKAEGRVESIKEAEQGGKYVTVNGEEYYVSPDLPVVVKEGDLLEPGDPLSEGLINPRDIVELRGLGSARRYYADRMARMLADSGAGGNKRNTEVVAKAALNHLIVEDPTDDYLPDDAVTYHKFSANYAADEKTVSVSVREAEGKYLQAPALHYTVGTKLTRKMINRLTDSGFDTLPVSTTEPYFKPTMSNLRRSSHISDDWLAKQNTSYLVQNLVDSTVRGEDTNISENTHFAPRLAIGKDFGRDIENTGKF